MAMVQQKLRAVFLRSDGIVVDLLKYFCAADIDFVTAGCAAVSADLAAYNQGRFLAKRFQRVPRLWRDGILQHNALNDAGTVAQLREKDFSTRAQVVKPALESYFLAVVLRKLIDVGLLV